MKQLLLKDFSLCRHIIFLGMALLFTPYIFMAASAIQANPQSWDEAINLWSVSMGSGAVLGAAFSLLTIVLLGSYIVAGERQDRTAEFLAYLPPGRHQVLISKALICLGVLVFIWGVYFFVISAFVPWLSDGDHVQYGHAKFHLMFYSFAAFGASWGASCIFESPLAAVLVGLMLPFATLYISMLTISWLGLLPANTTDVVWIYFELAFALACFAGGWFYYVRRIEP